MIGSYAKNQFPPTIGHDHVLVAIVKKRLDLDASLYTLLQILSVTLFEKMPIHQTLAGDENRCNASQITNQLNLFDFSPDTSDNAQWIVEKNGYLSPAQARQAWHAAISIRPAA